VLVRLDTSTMDAELAKDEAAVAAAREQFAAAKTAIAAANADITSAQAAIAQQQSEVRLAQTEADRQGRMLAENATSKALFDVRQTAVQTKKQTLESAQAQADAAQAQASAAHSRADAAQQEIGVALAQAERTKSRIKDATLVSPVTGRVLYRLVEPGEVVGPGGKALTLVDLSDVYMEIYLPSNLAAALKFGADARITADYEPNAAAAAHVTFVSPEAQFTPKQVETKSEREKLMFRVKIQVPPDLVEHYIERIKTGVRGVGYVKVDPSAKWPDWLEKGLINPERVSESEFPGSSGTSK
jgi:HlyD family secretion protein